MSTILPSTSVTATSTSSDEFSTRHRGCPGSTVFFAFMKPLFPLLLLLTSCTLTKQTSSLHEAVKRNDSAAVARLIAKGTAVDTKDADGLTPLMLACMNLQEENIRLLIRAGANPHNPNAAGTTAAHMLERGDSIPSRVKACRKAMLEELRRR